MTNDSRLLWYEHSVPPSDLARLVNQKMLIASDADGGTWLRFVNEKDADNEVLISKLTAQPLRLAADGKLFMPGCQVAHRQLPELSWLNFDEEVPVDWPVAVFPESQFHDSVPSSERVGRRLGLELRRIEEHDDRCTPAIVSLATRPASAMLVDLDSFRDWVSRASAARMRSLRWVLVGDRGLVFGQPLPPIAGVHLLAHERLLIPAGWHWSPNFPPHAVQTVLDAAHPNGASMWHLWMPDQTVVRIPDASFIAVQRASVRQAAALALPK